MALSYTLCGHVLRRDAFGIIDVTGILSQQETRFVTHSPHSSFPKSALNFFLRWINKCFGKFDHNILNDLTGKHNWA